MTWNLADAANRFSEVFRLAITEGPQTISRRGDEVILISKDEFLRRAGERESFTEFLLGSPALEGVELKRSPEGMRTVSR